MADKMILVILRMPEMTRNMNILFVLQLIETGTLQKKIICCISISW